MTDITITEIQWSAAVDHAHGFGKKLSQLWAAASGKDTGIPAVSLLDDPVKGCFVAHGDDGVDYLVEYTRLPPRT